MSDESRWMNPVVASGSDKGKQSQLKLSSIEVYVITSSSQVGNRVSAAVLV